MLIDDHEVGRAGRQALLEACGHRVRPATWSAIEALELHTQGDVDVTLAVVRADARSWDRYAALGSRQPGGGFVGLPPGRVLAALAPTALANPLLGVRLANRGIDEVVPRPQVDDAEALDAVARGTVHGLPVAPSVAALARVGVGRRSDPDLVIERVTALAATDPAYLRAFEPGLRQNESGLSRRRVHTLRVKVAEAGDLLPRADRGVGGPVRDWSLPSWTDVVAFVNRCRGVVDEYGPSLAPSPPLDSAAHTA
ncbi:MAG: hypothetical protein R2746_10530 [Acidimicrobiales bacterium]